MELIAMASSFSSLASDDDNDELPDKPLPQKLVSHGREMSSALS